MPARAVTMPPQILAAGAIGALLVGVATGWTVRDWRADSEQLAAVQEAEQERERLQRLVEDQADAFEMLRARGQAAAIAERNTIREIYRNVEVAADCAVPADAVSVLDQARRRANAATAGEPGSTLPGNPAAAGAAD